MLRAWRDRILRLPPRFRRFRKAAAVERSPAPARRPAPPERCLLDEVLEFQLIVVDGFFELAGLCGACRDRLFYLLGCRFCCFLRFEEFEFIVVNGGVGFLGFGVVELRRRRRFEVAVVNVVGAESERPNGKHCVGQKRRNVNLSAVQNGAVRGAHVAKHQEAVLLGQFAVLAADQGMGDGQSRIAAATDDRWQFQRHGRLVGLSADDNKFGIHGQVVGRAGGEQLCNNLSYSEAAAAAITRRIGRTVE